VAGFHDWTMDGIHLCTTRLDLLKLNTARALDPAVLAHVAALPRSSAALRALGRLPCPMHRRRGESGFRRVSWDEALALAAARIRESAPDRIGFYLMAQANALIAGGRRDPVSGVPDYNATVELARP